MSKRLLPGMTTALFDSDLIATRLALALAELLWATMLFWPGDTFQRPAYSLMREIAPELTWATVFLITSALQYAIVATYSCRTRLAHWFATWNAFLWVMTVTAMMLSIYPPPAAIGGEIALMVSAVWIWVRPLIERKWERLHGYD